MKAVLFDMDGVLADTEGFYNRRRAAYLAEVLPEYDGPWDFAGSNDKAIWETIVPGDPVLRERLHAGYDAYRAEHPEDYRVLGNPEAPAVLRALKQRDVQFLLQRLDLLAHGALHDAAFPGGLRKAPMPGG